MRKAEKRIDRRDFFKALGAAGFSSVLISTETRGRPGESNAVDPNEPAKPRKSKYPQVPKRKLGKTRVEVPCLALGTIFNVVENQIVLREAFKRGVTYWDTAPDYAGPNSELGIGKFLVKNPAARKKLFLSTKASDATSVADMEERLQASLKRMNTKYIDLYMVMDFIARRGYDGHGLSDPAQLTDELREWVKSAKKRKLIKFFGFSTHKNMAECLGAAAKLDWIDVVMTLYNFRFMQDAKMQAAIEACHKAGIGLIAMKTQAFWPKGGKDEELYQHFLGRGFTEQQAKIKVVLEDKRFSSACVGMQTVSHMTSNVAAALDKTKLTHADIQRFKEYAHKTRSSYCAGCAQICESALPDGPCISDIMRYLMYYNSYGDRARARQLFAKIPSSVRNGLLSTNYSLAEARCPQHLPIGELVAEAIGKLG
jgi:predicted aldo/keto reductase-like oxidoreductase